MDLMPAAAALAVILITAGFIMRTAPAARDEAVVGTPPRTPQQPAYDDDSAVAADQEDAELAAVDPGADPWVVRAEQLIVEEAAVIADPGPAPVLAYIDQPKRSPDPDRLIQTEVLVRSGSVARAWGAMRLALSLLALGAALGFGLIGFVRALVWMFSSG